MLTKQQTIYTLFGIMLVSGYSYSIDWPQALETPLRQPPYEFNSFQFNIIYFTTNLPICLLGIPLGMLLDKISFKLGILSILTITLISQLVIALLFEFTIKNFYAYLLIMRAIYGMTGEGAYTMQAILIQKIGGKNYQTMMGMCLTIPLFFGAIQSVITTGLYDSTHNMAIPLLIASGVGLLSFISGFFLIFYLKCQSSEQIKVSETADLEVEQFHCSDFKKFNYAFWIIILLTFFGQSSMGAFIDNANDMIVKRFSFPYVDAGRMLIIPFGFTPVGAYFWGAIIKKYPHWRRNFFIIINVLTVLCHVIIYTLSNTETAGLWEYTMVIIALFLFSIAFAGLCTIIIPSCALMVPSKAIGTAYGASGSAGSLSQAFMPLFNALIISEGSKLQSNYRNLSLMYMCLGIASLIVTTSMRLLNKSQLLKLDQPQQEPRESLITDREQFNQISNERQG